MNAAELRAWVAGARAMLAVVDALDLGETKLRGRPRAARPEAQLEQLEGKQLELAPPKRGRGRPPKAKRADERIAADAVNAAQAPWGNP